MSVQPLKSGFLQGQISGVLSQPLTISDDTAATLAPDVPVQAIQDATLEVNRLVNAHYAKVYFPLAVQSVAQQIDQLYWDEAAPESDDPSHLDAGLGWSTNLATTEGMSDLPENWDDNSVYSEKLVRLRDLHAQRDALTLKMAQLHKLAQLIAPFEQPQETVQPSLVTREGELVDELAKTRQLTTRVRALASQQAFSTDESHTTADEADELSQTQKLQALLRNK